MLGSDGMVQLDVEVRGDGRPLVFLHGLTFDRQLLLAASEPVFERGAPKARRLYVDLPGHGATPSDERAASAEGLVLALAAWLDTACSEPPILIGHSYGGYLALGLATLRPVAALALVCPVVEPDVARRTVPPRRVAKRDPSLTYAADERAQFEEIAVVETAAVLAEYQRLVQPASERTDRAFLEAVRARYVLPVPLVSHLPDVPALVLCGRDDHWVGYEDALLLVRALPACELAIVPGCGQLLPIESPARYRAILGGFLSRHLD